MVRTGLQRVLAEEGRVLRGKRIGLLVNPTSVDEKLGHVVDLLHARSDVDLRCLFGPEHGVRGDAQDMVGVMEARDSVTGLPMYSLYGRTEESLHPLPQMLVGLDAVVFDMQDIGSRYYTYVWTLLHMMQACAKLGIEVIVLDRPNPIGGVEVEGGTMGDEYRSFVGRAKIPNRHGMTAGEIALMVNETEAIGCPLEIVPMSGWKREMHFDQTGLPWVLPSPNMPTLDTALVYPGMCLVEGTELSEARGTTRPFELVGAPFVSFAEARALAEMLHGEDLPGVRFRPAVFTPTFHKFAHKRCGGVQLHVQDRRVFRPYRTGVAVIRAFRQMWPKQFHWRKREYEFVKVKPAIDLLTGGPEVREGIDAGNSLDAIASTWRAAETDLARQRTRWLLY
ncbi:MAG: DUF1343 domain-containing protein [Deltaproteobacteria bacterium]|nr:DUF1343 domain-containing protein [Deltaproteobacteria bacterium]